MLYFLYSQFDSILIFNVFKSLIAADAPEPRLEFFCCKPLRPVQFSHVFVVAAPLILSWCHRESRSYRIQVQVGQQVLPVSVFIHDLTMKTSILRV